MVGYGWTLGFPAIARSLRNGIPSYDDTRDIFEYAGQELVPESASAQLPRVYHTQRESFVRIVHETTDTWSATDRNGVVMHFGLAADARIQNAQARTYQWLLSEQDDLHGNAFTVSYDRRDAGTAYPSQIVYTLRRQAGGGLQALDGDASRNRTVQFVLGSDTDRPDTPVSYRAGLQSTLAHRLDYIDVTIGGRRLRRYDLSYVQSPDSTRSLLDSVAETGVDGGGTPRVTRFTYASNVRDGTAGWQLASWSWPAGLSLIDASQQDKGVRIADIDGDGLPDLVKALATQNGSDPTTASWTLTADSGVYFNFATGFSSSPDTYYRFPSYSGTGSQQIPFAFAWQSGSTSYTTGFDAVDLDGNGTADLVGGMRSLSATDDSIGQRTLLGMPAWYATKPRSAAGPMFTPVNPGDPYADGFWGLNRYGIVDIYYHTPTFASTAGNARFADLDGDGLPELIVRGAEYKWTAVGGAPPVWAVDAPPTCIDEELTNYYFENLGGLAFQKAATRTGSHTSSTCGSSLVLSSTDFQQCDLTTPLYSACAFQVAYSLADAFHFGGDPYAGHFPWYWLDTFESGSVDIDLNGDGLADSLAATSDPVGLGSVSTAWLNGGSATTSRAPHGRSPPASISTNTITSRPSPRSSTTRSIRASASPISMATVASIWSRPRPGPVATRTAPGSTPATQRPRRGCHPRQPRAHRGRFRPV